MKKIIALILCLILILGALSGCVAGKKAMLFVEDTESASAKLLWAGFRTAAKKLGMKPVLSGLNEETSIQYTPLQVWEQDLAEQSPDVLVVAGLSDSGNYDIFRQSGLPLVAVDPIDLSDNHSVFCVYGASPVDLARVAAEQFIDFELPSSGRIRLLYNSEDSAVADTFSSLLTDAGYNNIEITPLSGRANELSILNNFTEDTVAVYNASAYDTEVVDLSNLILTGITLAHLEALTANTASSLLSRNDHAVGDAAAHAAALALRHKEATAVTVDPILVTANGPEQNGAAYWLDILS